MIVCHCPHCRRRLEIADAYAGRVGRCAYCGGEIKAVSEEAAEALPVFSGSQLRWRGLWPWVALAAVVAAMLTLPFVISGLYAPQPPKPQERPSSVQQDRPAEPPARAAPGALPVGPAAVTRGMAVLASAIGATYAVGPLTEFVAASGFNQVVVDWAWVTAHWDKTDFDAVRQFVDALHGRGVEVWAMYRPRFLDNPTVPVQVKADGSPAFDHGYEIRYGNAEARRWGVSWGVKILTQCPAFSEVVVYNPRNIDASPESRATLAADPDAANKAVVQFLREAKAAWRAIKPDVRLGLVYVADPGLWRLAAPVVDAAHPFLSIKADVDMKADTQGVAALRGMLGEKFGACIAKVTWGETDKVSPDELTAFNVRVRELGLHHIFWMFDTLFDSTLYNPQEVAQALAFDYPKLVKPLRDLRSAQSVTAPAAANRSAHNYPTDWIYFVSKENAEGQPPRLVLTFNTWQRTIPTAADTVLISYLAERAGGAHGKLSINLNDTNRVLLQFDIPRMAAAQPLTKAELLLDTRPGTLPSREPFDAAVYRVKEPWTEGSATWNNPPAFNPVAAATFSIPPQSAILSVDITPLVQQWYEGRPNYGLLIKAPQALAEAPAPEPAANAEPVAPGTPPGYSRVEPKSLPSPDIPLPPVQSVAEPLPWPHEAPGLSAEQKAALSRDVWIINNFPLYQPGDINAYCHNGFDIVLDNGAPIYAMKDGYIKSVRNQTVIVADTQGGEPSWGWAYTHVGGIAVTEGAFVQRGTRIGAVDFKGLPHVHLQQVYSQAPQWGEWQYCVMPDAHFTYPDDDPPVIHTPLCFFKNGSNEQCPTGDDGTVMVSGGVDIVAGMREQGLYAHSRENSFGDRLAVARIRYEIRSVNTGAVQTCSSFDFTRLAIKEGVSDTEFNTNLSNVLYKHLLLFEPERKNGDKVFTYYIITNCPTNAPPRELRPELAQYAWRTAARDANGAPLFSDGAYDIVVIAEDFKGHAAEARTRVTVHNAATTQ